MHDNTGEAVSSSSVRQQWKNGRLHEFQARLLERMSAARDGSGMRDSRLGVMIGDRYCLLDLREAGEIVSTVAITKVPLTRDWYLGLANVRGNLIGVVDLERFLGGELQVQGKASRVIVVSAALSGTSGFMVSRVLGLRHIQEMTLQEMPQQNEDDAITDAGKCYVDGDMTPWTEISLAAIVEDQRFLHVGL
jgi:twitching motility protein PilI